MKSYIFAGALFSGVVSAQQGAWAQCGGIGWTGLTTCISGYVCTVGNPYYSQCLPGTASTTVVSSTAKPTSTVSSTSPTSTSLTKFAGINISGFDFGCDTTGTCNISGAWPPMLQYYGNDGIGQMQHFVKDDKLNVFRLPTSWQYMTNGVASGALDATNVAIYDQLVQACLATGATCEIDIHNYARWNGQIIGQGGPTNAQFAAFWGALAAKYATTKNIIFGVMNEPHDIPAITTWGQTVQAAVTAIRNAGATSQMILLPGSDYASAQQFISDGSAAALLGVTNPNGTTTGLIFDVHKYLDSDNSGTNAECVTNNIDNAFAPLATYLRTNKRQAFLTETGGGNVASCETYMCQQVAYLNANSDVFLGYIGWAAGNFDAATYVLSEVPTDNNGVWTDSALVSACLAR